MPYVNVRLIDDGVTAAQKDEVISGITDVLVRVLNKNPETTVVVIDEVSTDNWGRGGKSLTTARREAKPQIKA
jgi:4-oxalocrotonate tautomerase